MVNINHIREVVPWFKSSYQLRMNDKKQTEIPVSRVADEAAAGTVQSVEDTSDALGCGALAVASGGFAEE